MRTAVAMILATALVVGAWWSMCGQEQPEEARASVYFWPTRTPESTVPAFWIESRRFNTEEEFCLALKDFRADLYESCIGKSRRAINPPQPAP